jgi:hypothetical protein
MEAPVLPPVPPALGSEEEQAAATTATATPIAILLAPQTMTMRAASQPHPSGTVQRWADPKTLFIKHSPGHHIPDHTSFSPPADGPVVPPALLSRRNVASRRNVVLPSPSPARGTSRAERNVGPTWRRGGRGVIRRGVGACSAVRGGRQGDAESAAPQARQRTSPTKDTPTSPPPRDGMRGALPSGPPKPPSHGSAEAASPRVRRTSAVSRRRTRSRIPHHRRHHHRHHRHRPPPRHRRRRLPPTPPPARSPAKPRSGS